MNSVNGGREVEESLNKKKNERNKKENKRNKEVGAKISAPTLKTQPRAKLTQSTQKKKKNLFQSFQVSFKLQIFNSNFSFPSRKKSTFSMPKYSNSNLQFLRKNSNLRFHDQNFKP